MKEDESQSFFVDSTDMPETNFDKIKSNQNFYVNDIGELVIIFDKYEVAPGFMGSQEFTIPTDSIKTILSEQTLIK